MTDTDWLQALKVGDPVIVSLRMSYRIETVTRLTTTQIVVGTIKFNKENGHKEKSDTWNNAWLVQYTVEKAEVIKLTNLRRTVWTALNNIKKADVERLGFTQCQELFAYLKLMGLTNYKE